MPNRFCAVAYDTRQSKYLLGNEIQHRSEMVSSHCPQEVFIRCMFNTAILPVGTTFDSKHVTVIHSDMFVYDNVSLCDWFSRPP